MGEGLTDEQINRAFRLFYGDGMNLGQVMQDLGCGLYDLTPWLPAAGLRIADAAIRSERERVAALQPKASSDE